MDAFVLLRLSVVVGLLWLQLPLESSDASLNLYNNKDSVALPVSDASCTTYTVKSGDTCYDIAEAHGISLSDFLSMNPGIDCSNLQIGQVVCISSGGGGGCTTYTVKSGDTCYAIAQANGISLSDFLSMNPGIDCSNLQIGQVVCISAGGGGGGGGGGNSNVFSEYIGALWNGVTFSDVPINTGVQFHFILSFAIDYTSDGSSATNGQFSTFWDNNLTPSSVKAIKSAYQNVKVMLSLGGDTVSGNAVQFNPSSVSSWVNNAVSSLTSLIQQYDLDGIDIDYEHFDLTTQNDFTSCIGQLITRLKQNNVISVATIAPFDGVRPYYTALWQSYSSVIDYVNFQFYTYGTSTTSAQYVNYYNQAALQYSGGKVLASFSTAPNNGVTPQNALSGCQQLRSNGNLPGIFIWAADTSFVSAGKFQYEQQAQSLLTGSSTDSEI